MDRITSILRTSLRSLIKIPDNCPECGEANWKIIYVDGEQMEVPRECPCRLKLRLEHEKNMKNIENKEVQERIQKLFQDSMMSRRFKDRTFENFKAYNDSLSFAYGTAKKYAYNFDNNRKLPRNGIIFMGGVGSGKTHLAASIANYLINNETSVVFSTMSDILDKIREGFNSETKNILQTVKSAELLVIDDFGKEGGTDWVKEQIYKVINSRYENNLPIVITTEFTGKAILGKYDKAVYSRINESCVPIKIEADDYRLPSTKGAHK